MTRVRLALLGLLVLAGPLPAAARPTYFEVITGKYGIVPGDRIYACGICHYKWEGTGARNPFGTTVEQQLYAGKPISQAIDDAVGQDPDADGFTSLEELTSFETLPGFSCANFFESIGPPPDWHTFITPGVPSCLEPLDIRTDPTQVTFQTNAGSSESETLTIFNNGKDEPLEVLSYGLLPGAHPALSVEGPAAPFTLQVGETAELTVSFAPTGAVLTTTALRIQSDDPDEANLDVGLTAVGRVQPLATPEKRAACLKDVDREARRFTKDHLKEWARCQGDEAKGFACDAGVRDRKLTGASAHLHEEIGGAKDKRCAGAGLTPRLAGQPETCGGGCGAIELGDFVDLADCLACRQEEETDAMLVAALGAAPPDRPIAVPGDAADCAASLLKGVQKGITKTQQQLGRCELANVTADEPVDCQATLAEDLAKLRADVDARLAKCRSTEGLAGCYSEDPADPTCLGSAAGQIGAELVDAAFGLEE